MSCCFRVFNINSVSCVMNALFCIIITSFRRGGHSKELHSHYIPHVPMFDSEQFCRFLKLILSFWWLRLPAADSLDQQVGKLCGCLVLKGVPCGICGHGLEWKEKWRTRQADSCNAVKYCISWLGLIVIWTLWLNIGSMFRSSVIFNIILIVEMYV